MAFPIEVTGCLVVDLRARDWCKLTYPGHPSGCPNFGHKDICPPRACQVSDFLDTKGPLWLVVEPFDLAGHMASMKTKHPGWSDRQLRCVLYWQAGVNNRLETACRRFIAEKGNGWVYTICPEAMGVHVINTARQAGLPVETRPTEWVFKMGLVGIGK